MTKQHHPEPEDLVQAELETPEDTQPEEELEAGDVVSEIVITEEQIDTLAAELTPPPAEDAGAALMRIVDNAVASAQPIEVIERLLAVHERYEAGLARKDYSAAIAALRADLPAVLKTETVDYPAKGKGRVTYRHEALANIVEDLSPPMAQHGLSFRWRTEQPSPNLVRVTCIVTHAAGHYEETVLEGPPDNSGNKNQIQAIASTVSYLQRYTLKAAVGLAAGKDDDGAGGAPTQEPIAAPRSTNGGGTSSVPGDVLEVEKLADVRELFPAGEVEPISGNQVGRLRNVAQKSGWTNEGVDAELGLEIGCSVSEIPSLGDAYEATVRWFETHSPTS